MSSFGKLVDIAEAVKTTVNAGTYTSATITAARAYVPSHAVARADAFTVYVFPIGSQDEEVNRSAIEQRVEIAVAVCRRVDPGDNAKVDAVMRLAEEIREHLRDTDVTLAAGRAEYASSQIDAFDPELLHQNQTALSLVRVTYLTYT